MFCGGGTHPNANCRELASGEWRGVRAALLGRLAASRAETQPCMGPSYEDIESLYPHRSLIKKTF